MLDDARNLKEATGKAEPVQPGRSRCSPDSGPTCRSRRCAGSPRSGATTGWRSPAGVTISTWRKAAEDEGYVQERKDILAKHGLGCWAISNHLNGQAVCEAIIDDRYQSMVNPRVWGDGDPEGVRQRAAEEMKTTARAAAAFGVDTVVGFTGSPSGTTWRCSRRSATTSSRPVTPTSPTAGTRSSTSSTRSASGSPTRCTRARSRTTTGRRSQRWRRSVTGRASGSTSTRRTWSGRAWTTSASCGTSGTGSTTWTARTPRCGCTTAGTAGSARTCPGPTRGAAGTSSRPARRHPVGGHLPDAQPHRLRRADLGRVGGRRHGPARRRSRGARVHPQHERHSPVGSVLRRSLCHQRVKLPLIDSVRPDLPSSSAEVASGLLRLQSASASGAYVDIGFGGRGGEVVRLLESAYAWRRCFQPAE